MGAPGRKRVGVAGLENKQRNPRSANESPTTRRGTIFVVEGVTRNPGEAGFRMPGSVVVVVAFSHSVIETRFRYEPHQFVREVFNVCGF